MGNKTTKPPAYSEHTAPPYAPSAAFASAPPSEGPIYPMVSPAPLPPRAPPTVENVTVVNTVVVDNGRGMICPKCNARIRLRVEHHATGSTYCLAAILCLFFCWPCVCLPCCCNCCYKTSQFCPNCNACLGSF